MQFFNNDHMAHKPLHVDRRDNTTSIVGAFFVFTILVGIGLYLFATDFLSPFVIILLSVGGGVTAAMIVAKKIKRAKAEHISQSDEDMRINRKAETQKQIDAMLRGNSNIPEVNK